MKAKIGDVLNKITYKQEVKYCFLPQNLINARTAKMGGELIIGVSEEIAEQFASQALSDEPCKLAGILIFFDRENYNQALDECKGVE